VQVTGISEKGRETPIMLHLTGSGGRSLVPEGIAAETPDAISAAKASGSVWHASCYKRLADKVRCRLIRMLI